eukprot:Nk52_evm18s359 gene=Nk52_evmTU18s359
MSARSIPFIDEKYLLQAEEYSEEVFRRGRKVLPTVARLFLTATFIDDGYRLFFQWTEQASYIARSLGWGFAFAYMFLLLNIILQLGGSALVVARKHVEIGVYALFTVVLSQTLVYSSLWDLNFFLRNLALCGGLILLLAECQEGTNRVIAGLPDISDGGSTQKGYMQLAGRLLLVLMFFSLIHFSNVSLMKVLFYIVGGALTILISIGFKTRLSALVLVTMLVIFNFFLNNWWTLPAWSHVRDFLKYDFFQTLSVAGGLLLVASLGAGKMSVDEKKKKF